MGEPLGSDDNCPIADPQTTAPTHTSPPGPTGTESWWTWENVGNTAGAIGDGIMSAPGAILSDAYHGGTRVLKETSVVRFGRWYWDREDVVQEERLKRRFADQLAALFKTGLADGFRPIVEVIMENWYEPLPDCAKEHFKNEAIAQGVVMASEFTSKLLTKMLLKKLLEKLVNRLVAKIIASEAAKQVIQRLGISAAVAGTGVGIPVALILSALGFLAMLEKAIEGAQRFQNKHPILFEAATVQNVELLFYLVEEPLTEKLSQIKLAQENPAEFERITKSLFCN